MKERIKKGIVELDTKQAILARHVTNDLLAAPTLPVVGCDEYDLSADHPTMQPEPAVIEYVIERLKAGETHYVDVPGMPPLRKALAADLQANGYAADVANILVTAGMQETRFLSLQILGRLLGPVGVPSVVHPGVHKALGVRPLQVAAPLPTAQSQGFLATMDGIEAALESGVRVLYLESPVRLSGRTYDKRALSHIAKLATQHNIAVIWDQGLAPWVPGYQSIWNEPGMAQRTVLLAEAFPGVGLESWYLGFITTNPEWFEKIRRDKQAISICTSTTDQLAAIKIAETYGVLLARQLEHLTELRNQAAMGLGGRAVPGAAASIVAVELSDPFAGATLRKAGFGFADGTDFGARGIIRLAVTPDNAIANAISILR